MAHGRNRHIHVIGGADGPTSVFVAGKASRRGARSWMRYCFHTHLSIGLLITLFLCILSGGRRGKKR